MVGSVSATLKVEVIHLFALIFLIFSMAGSPGSFIWVKTYQTDCGNLLFTIKTSGSVYDQLTKDSLSNLSSIAKY